MIRFYDFNDFKHRVALLESFPIEQVGKTSDWKAQLRKIARAYAQFQRRVDAGCADWMEFEPYEIGDWAAIFTPIEQETWSLIRRSGLPLWPQLPVGRYFVDFGNPVVKVALECDGAAYHDADKDAKRDKELRSLGWHVYRVPGWRCLNEVDPPEDPAEMSEDDWEAYHREKYATTPLGVLRELANHFPGHMAERVWRML